MTFNINREMNQEKRQNSDVTKNELLGPRLSSMLFYLHNYRNKCPRVQYKTTNCSL